MTENNQDLLSLLDYCSSEGRICPQPSEWKKLWEMLPDRRRVGGGWEPALPLILAAWDHTSLADKKIRLKEHIEYGAEKGVLSRLDQFLRGLEQEKWFTPG